MADETPNLHLSRTGTADEIQNWEKIDDLVGALAGPGSIFPGDVEIQGDLTVDGDTTLNGLTKAVSDLEVFGNSALLGFLGVNGMLTARGGLTVTGAQPVVFPPGAIQPAALAPMAAVRGVWVSPASGQQAALGGTPAQIVSVQPDAQEVTGTWEIVVGQLTFGVNLPNSPSATVSATFDLRRGTASQQMRTLSWLTAAAVNLNADYPLTIFRVAIVQPQDIGTPWSIWGSAGGTVANAVTPYFGQLHVIQLR